MDLFLLYSDGSIDRDRNALGLDSRLLGDLDLEHAIGVVRLDRIDLEPGGLWIAGG